MNLFNIAIVIILTKTISDYTRLPLWIVIIPVTYVIFSFFSIDSIFFNKKKEGVVDIVSNEIFYNIDSH